MAWGPVNTPGAVDTEGIARAVAETAFTVPAAKDNMWFCAYNWVAIG